MGLAFVLLGSAGLAASWAPAQHASPDSAMYLDGARQLAGGHGFRTTRVALDRTEPVPLSAWPPGFSLLLAAGLAGGASGGQAAAAVLFLSFVAFGGLAYLLMVMVTDRRGVWLAALLTVPILLHPGTLRSLDAILADLPFAAIATGVLCLAVFLARRDDPAPRAVFALGLLAGLAVLVRWAGVYWAVAILLGFLAAQATNLERVTLLKRAAAFSLGLGVVVVPWFARNLLRTGSLAGPRRADPSSPLAAAADAAEGAFAALSSVGNVPPMVIAIALAATGAALVASGAWRDRAVRVLLAAALGYPALLVASWALAPFDPLTRDRFWLPLWPVAAALFLAIRVHCEGRRWLATGTLLVGLAVGVPATLSFATAYAQRLPAARLATGLASPVWAGSAPVRFLQQHGHTCTVVSSEPRVHLIHNTLPRVHLLPTSVEGLSPLLERGDRLCLVYLRQSSTGSAHKRRADHQALLRDLEAAGRVRRVAGDDVGDVWRMETPAR